MRVCHGGVCTAYIALVLLALLAADMFYCALVLQECALVLQALLAADMFYCALVLQECALHGYYRLY
jgi:hypothetical protein